MSTWCEDLEWLSATGVVPLPVRLRRYSCIVDEVARVMADLYVELYRQTMPTYRLDTDRYTPDNLWKPLARRVLDDDVNPFHFIDAAFRYFGRPYPNVLLGDEAYDWAMEEYYGRWPGSYVYFRPRDYARSARDLIDGSAIGYRRAREHGLTPQQALEVEVSRAPNAWHWCTAVQHGIVNVEHDVADVTRDYLLASNARRRCFHQEFANMWDQQAIPERTTTMKRRELTDEVRAIGTLVDDNRIVGNVIPAAWYEHIVVRTDSGRVHADLAGIAVMSEVLYWYRPSATGRRKFDADLLQLSYKELGDRLHLSKNQVKAACHRLVKTGFIRTELRSIRAQDGRLLNNVLFIEVVPERIRAISPVVHRRPTDGGPEMPPTPLPQDNEGVCIPVAEVPLPQE